jgi:hypothetical protein
MRFPRWRGTVLGVQPRASQYPLGVNINALQRMPGHASVSTTPDTCAALFDEDLGKVAEQLGRERARKIVEFCRGLLPI